MSAQSKLTSANSIRLNPGTEAVHPWIWSCICDTKNFYSTPATAGPDEFNRVGQRHSDGPETSVTGTKSSTVNSGGVSEFDPGLNSAVGR